MQWLTRAIRTPLSEIDEDSDLCQELKVTPTEQGDMKQIKSVNKLNAVQQLAAIAQYTAPQVNNLTINNNTLNLGKLDTTTAATSLAAEFAQLTEQPSNVIEAEIITQPEATKQRRTNRP